MDWLTFRYFLFWVVFNSFYLFIFFRDSDFLPVRNPSMHSSKREERGALNKSNKCVESLRDVLQKLQVLEYKSSQTYTDIQIYLFFDFKLSNPIFKFSNVSFLFRECDMCTVPV